MTKKIVVQKYGGSSLATPEKIRKVAKHIKKTTRSSQVVAVVSARGNQTDELIDLARELTHKPSTTELDKLLVTGEMQSAALLAMALHTLGEKAISLSGYQIGLTADPRHGEAKIIGVQKIERVEKLLAQGNIVVVTGFQAIINGTDEPITLGRDSSDLTAIVLAAGLKTGYCEIYTDVDGFYSIDPKLVPEAMRYDEIDHNHALQLASAGAKVLMPRSIILAQNLGVSVKVLLSPSIGKTTGGTYIRPGSSIEHMEGLLEAHPGIAIKEGLSLVKISRIPNKPGWAAKILQQVSTINIVDAVQGGSKEESDISILYNAEDSQEAVAQLTKLKALKITEMPDMVAITVVDPAADQQPGYLLKICKALGKAGVNIEMISTTNITIMLIIKRDDLKKAAKALGEQLGLIR